VEDPAIHTATPLPLDAPRLPASPTPPWIWNPEGEAVVPILLYHRIGTAAGAGRYALAQETFGEQMSALRRWGYTSIPVSRLLQAIDSGAELPPRPVVITFDDGNADVYEVALPIMERFGFAGAVYVVSSRVGAEGFLSEEQLRALLRAGWEVGSHSMTHADLVASHDLVRQEVLYSRLALERTLEVRVTSFAYPFGRMDAFLARKVSSYGYRGAMGLGKTCRHDRSSLYYLSRLEIRADMGLEAFAALLNPEGPFYQAQPPCAGEG
jgi:peptidoglycan/xylan/chitin deacetylase (PgdA/CDA1 family)